MRNQKILFTLGQWNIRKWNMYRGSFINCEKCDATMEIRVLDTQDCSTCEARIPDEVVGLWIMLNADRMPALAQGHVGMMEE